MRQPDPNDKRARILLSPDGRPKPGDRQDPHVGRGLIEEMTAGLSAG